MRPNSKAAAMVVAVVVMAAAMVVQEAGAARILMAAPIGSRSHKIFFSGIIDSLVQRNHTVTLVTRFKSSHPRPNVREVIVSAGESLFNIFSSPFTTSLTTAMMESYGEMHTHCVHALASPEVQSLNDEEFDLVIVQASLTECFLSFVHKLKVPFIYVHPNTLFGAYSDLAGTPFFPSLKANFLLDLDYPLTFKGRMISTLYEVLGKFSNLWILEQRMDELCRAQKLCHEDMPSLAELSLNSSLFILNSVKTMEQPTLPYTPTVVHAGGIHCHPAKPLPKDLEEWVAGAGDHGFIFFSLGSLIKPSDMPEKYLRVMLQVFGSLQQRVLWKWDEDTMEGLPHNVRLAKWFPQQDILGHPQLRLFITHGGLLSTQEACYHGVPVLGMPASIDQYHNMRLVQREGWGRVLHWEELTSEALLRHIREIADDPRVREEVQRRSRVMRDQPVPPGEWAAYWVEYVLRHQGAAHLRSHALHLPWYELYNVDVWATVVVVTVAVVGLAAFLCCKTLRALLACCRAPGRQKQD